MAEGMDINDTKAYEADLINFETERNITPKDRNNIRGRSKDVKS